MEIDTAWGPLQVHVHGDRADHPTDVIVLLHPLAMSGQLWQPFGEWLSRTGRIVVAPDLPAVGDGNLDDLTIEDMAGQVISMISRLMDGPVDLLGMSMGGCIAQQIALTRPDVVRRLVLVDTTSSYGPHRVDDWEDRARTVETTARDQLLDFQLRRWFTDAFRVADPAECERATRIFFDIPADVHAACCRALGAFDVTARLPDIAAPTLVLVGDADYATPPQMSMVLAENIRGARMVLLPQAGHYSILANPKAWAIIEEHFVIPQT